MARPKFVIMTAEQYAKLTSDDPRRAYGVGETPPDLAAMFGEALDKLASGQASDDDAATE